MLIAGRNFEPYTRSPSVCFQSGLDSRIRPYHGGAVLRIALLILHLSFPLRARAEYLGNLFANEFDPNSIANSYGACSPYSSNSVTNEFGMYGSPKSNRSSTNQFGVGHPYRFDSPTNPYGQGWRIEGQAEPANVIPPAGQRAPVLLPPLIHHHGSAVMG